MATKLMRKIVQIDEEKCDGCGECVPSCHEGAIQIINGKAKLKAENLCDGLGACLGHCPRGAITVLERPAEAFDEQAVKANLTPIHSHHGGCPGSQLRTFQKTAPVAMPVSGCSQKTSRLGQWPVQLALVPISAPIWQDADVLIAADCVPFAYPDFHEKMLAGKTLAIACPKLDDVRPYVEKLARIFAANTIKSITVAHMEVPCCTGIVRVVQAALAQSGRQNIPLHDITVMIDGTLSPQAAWV